MKHKFIVFEGIDGVGKTSLAEATAARLNSEGMPCVWYDKSPFKSSLLTPEKKRWAKEEATIEQSFRLYLESTRHQGSVVAGLLGNTSVVMDRYLYSVLSHHLALGLDPAYILFAESNCPPSDLTLHVVLPEALRLERLGRRPDSTEDDFISAEDDSTVLGRKRAWFSRLIEHEVSNAGNPEDTIESIFRYIV